MPNAKPTSCDTLSFFEKPDMARRRGQHKGELINRSGWWLLRYRVDTPEMDAATGLPKRERITITLAPSKGPRAIGKREADRMRAAHMATMDQFAIRPSSLRTLQEFIDQRFDPDVVATLKPTGRAFYKAMLGKHILPALGSLPLRDITVGRIQGLITAKLQSGLSVQTATHIRNCLSAAMRHARAMQWFVGELPTASVRLPEMKRKERRAMTWGQVCTLVQELPEPVSTLVVLLVVTGLRIGEAMGLRRKWVNLTDEPVLVNGELIPMYSIAIRENFELGAYQTLKTEKSTRNVPLPLWFVPRLAKHLAASEWQGPEAPVFAAGNGKPIDQHNVAARYLKPAAARAGMGTPRVPATATEKAKPAKSWVSWHVFRHTNATLADLAGFSVAERMKILGHAQEGMAMHYTHVELDQMRTRLNVMVDEKKLLN